MDKRYKPYPMSKENSKRNEELKKEDRGKAKEEKEIKQEEIKKEETKKEDIKKEKACSPTCLHFVTPSCQNNILHKRASSVGRDVWFITCKNNKQCFLEFNTSLIPYFPNHTCKRSFVVKRIKSREINAMQHIQHYTPNLLVPYFYHAPFLIMERFLRLDLVPWKLNKEIDTCMLNLLHSLKVLHDSRLVHRDIKPWNIVCEDGAPFFIDFGSAKKLQYYPLFNKIKLLENKCYPNEENIKITIQRTTNPCTYLFASPSVLLDFIKKREYSSSPLEETKLDIFSLGITWCHLLFFRNKIRYKPFEETCDPSIILYHLAHLLDQSYEDVKLDRKLVESYKSHREIIAARPLLRQMLTWDTNLRPSVSTLLGYTVSPTLPNLKPLVSSYSLQKETGIKETGIKETGIKETEKKETQRESSLSTIKREAALDWILNMRIKLNLCAQTWFYAAKLFDFLRLKHNIENGHYNELLLACALHSSSIYDVYCLAESNVNWIDKKKSLPLVDHYTRLIITENFTITETLLDITLECRQFLIKPSFAVLGAMHSYINGSDFTLLSFSIPKKLETKPQTMPIFSEIINKLNSKIIK